MFFTVFAAVVGFVLGFAFACIFFSAPKADRKRQLALFDEYERVASAPLTPEVAAIIDRILPPGSAGMRFTPQEAKAICMQIRCRATKNPVDEAKRIHWCDHK